MNEAQLIDHINKRADAIEDTVGELKKILTGNGHPEEGYVFRTAQCEHSIKNVKLGIQDLPDIRARVEKQEMKTIEFLRAHNEHKDNSKWWFRAIMGAAIVSTITSVGSCVAGKLELAQIGRAHV